MKHKRSKLQNTKTQQKRDLKHKRSKHKRQIENINDRSKIGEIENTRDRRHKKRQT